MNWMKQFKQSPDGKLWTVSEGDWSKFFGFGDSVTSIVTDIYVSSSAAGVYTPTIASAITRINASTSGLAAVTIPNLTIPWSGFQGRVNLFVSSTSYTVTLSSSGTGSGAMFVGSTIGLKGLLLTYDGTYWYPSTT